MHDSHSRGQNVQDSHMQIAARSRMAIAGGGHAGKKGWRAYSAKVKETIAWAVGRMMIKFTWRWDKMNASNFKTAIECIRWMKKWRFGTDHQMELNYMVSVHMKACYHQNDWLLHNTTNWDLSNMFGLWTNRGFITIAIAGCIFGRILWIDLQWRDTYNLPIPMPIQSMHIEDTISFDANERQQRQLPRVGERQGEGRRLRGCRRNHPRTEG